MRWNTVTTFLTAGLAVAGCAAQTDTPSRGTDATRVASVKSADTGKPPVLPIQPFVKDANDVMGVLSNVKGTYDFAAFVLQLMNRTDPNQAVLDALASDLRVIQGQFAALGLQNAQDAAQLTLAPANGLENDIIDWQSANPNQPFTLTGTAETQVNGAVGSLKLFTSWMRPRVAPQTYMNFTPTRADSWLEDNLPASRRQAGLWNDAEQWDWRVGLYPFIHSILDRMTLVTAAYPDWQRYPRGYIEEFAGYADQLDDVAQMMIDGIQCYAPYTDIPLINYTTRQIYIGCTDVNTDAAFGELKEQSYDPSNAISVLGLPSEKTLWVQGEMSGFRAQLLDAAGVAQLKTFADTLRFPQPVAPATSSGSVSGWAVYATSSAGTAREWVNYSDGHGWTANGDVSNQVALPPDAPIAVVTRIGGLQDLFVVDTTGTLQTRAALQFGNNSQTHWHPISLPGQFAPSTPVTAIARSANDIDVFAVTPGGKILDFRWDALNPALWAYGGWADPRFPIVVGTAPAGAHLAASSRTMLKLDLAWIDASGRISAAYWDGVPQVPGGWNYAATTTSAPFPPGAPITAVTRDGSDIDLFAVTTAGELANFGWHGASGWDRDYRAISGPNVAQQGGEVTAVVDNGEINVFASRSILHEWVVYNRWQGSWNPANAATIPLEAGANLQHLGAVAAEGGIDLFGTDAPGNVWHFARTDATNKWTLEEPLPSPIVLPGVFNHDAPPTTIGVVRLPDPNGSTLKDTWLLRRSNTPGDPDLSFSFAETGDIPVVGDWNGTGVMAEGYFRPARSTFNPTDTSQWFLRASTGTGLVVIAFSYGGVGDAPVVGDWTHSGRTGIGVYRAAGSAQNPSSASEWLLRNTASPGNPDVTFSYGGVGDLPVVGDWTQSGKTGIGVYRPAPDTMSVAQWLLRNTVSAGNPDIAFAYGAAGDMPLVGDWNGSGATMIGVYRPAHSPANGAADAQWLLRFSATPGNPEIQFAYGGDGDRPVVGAWRP